MEKVVVEIYIRPDKETGGEYCTFKVGNDDYYLAVFAPIYWGKCFLNYKIVVYGYDIEKHEKTGEVFCDRSCERIEEGVAMFLECKLGIDADLSILI